MWGVLKSEGGEMGDLDGGEERRETDAWAGNAEAQELTGERFDLMKWIDFLEQSRRAGVVLV